MILWLSAWRVDEYRDKKTNPSLWTETVQQELKLSYSNSLKRLHCNKTTHNFQVHTEQKHTGAHYDYKYISKKMWCQHKLAINAKRGFFFIYCKTEGQAWKLWPINTGRMRSGINAFTLPSSIHAPAGEEGETDLSRLLWMEKQDWSRRCCEVHFTRYPVGGVVRHAGWFRVITV